MGIPHDTNFALSHCLVLVCDVSLSLLSAWEILTTRLRSRDSVRVIVVRAPQLLSAASDDLI